MPSVCFYFQVHQPHRLRPYTVFDTDSNYFDEYKNGQICRKVVEKCYLPANQMMLDLIRQHEGRFRISYSLTGVVLEQFERHAPEIIDSFRDLAATGCVEFLGDRHYRAAICWRCAIAAKYASVMVARPVAVSSEDGLTAKVTLPASDVRLMPDTPFVTSVTAAGDKSVNWLPLVSAAVACIPPVTIEASSSMVRKMPNPRLVSDWANPST